jgi:septal ring factor EnvC (AmiA/AmiB activator)
MTQVTPSLRGMARPASPHRRRRTLRVTAASALLLLSVVGCLVTLLAASGAAAAVLPLLTLTGLVAALLLHAELRVERAEHAADRLAQAQSFTETFVARSAEHAAYASRTGAELTALRRHVRELEGTLRLAEARGDEAEHRLREERGHLFRAEVRIIELEVALERRQSDQIDELAEWPSDDVDTVVDLLNWEQRLEDGERRTRSA